MAGLPTVARRLPSAAAGASRLATSCHRQRQSRNSPCHVAPILADHGSGASGASRYRIGDVGDADSGVPHQPAPPRSRYRPRRPLRGRGAPRLPPSNGTTWILTLVIIGSGLPIISVAPTRVPITTSSLYQQPSEQSEMLKDTGAYRSVI